MNDSDQHFLLLEAIRDLGCTGHVAGSSDMLNARVFLCLVPPEWLCRSWNCEMKKLGTHLGTMTVHNSAGCKDACATQPVKDMPSDPTCSYGL